MCYLYNSLAVILLSAVWTESRTVKKLSFEFGGENEMNIGVLEALKGFDGSLSDLADVKPKSSENQEETTGIEDAPTPTIDYSNREPVVEEKIKKVTAFVLCVVGDEYNCADKLGSDIDIAKHLGPPPSDVETGTEEVTVTDRNVDVNEVKPTSMILLNNSDEMIANLTEEMFNNSPDFQVLQTDSNLSNDEDNVVVVRDVEDQKIFTPSDDANTPENTEDSKLDMDGVSTPKVGSTDDISSNNAETPKPKKTEETSTPMDVSNGSDESKSSEEEGESDHSKETEGKSSEEGDD